MIPLQQVGSDDPHAIPLPTFPDPHPHILHTHQPHRLHPHPHLAVSRSKLEAMINTLDDETEMMNALAQHEQITSVIAKYNEAVALAESFGGVEG